MIYALVCESGEYSNVEYEIVAYYETEAEAIQGKEYYDEERKLTEELVAIKRGYVTQREYSIVQVMKGKEGLENILQLRETYKKLFEEAKKEMAERKIKEIIEQEEKQLQYEKKIRNEIHAFLDWWESHDAYFEEKKHAKLRDISNAFIAYTTLRAGMDDHRAMKWYMENKELLWGHRGKRV